MTSGLVHPAGAGAGAALEVIELVAQQVIHEVPWFAGPVADPLVEVAVQG